MKRFKKIYVEITNVCNLNCSFCENNNRKKQYMKVEQFEEILHKIKDYTDYIYLHVKGEPLLHPDLRKLLDLCEEHKIKVNITTNGTLVDSVYDVLKRAKALRQLNLSLHSENNDSDYLKKIFTRCKELSQNIFVNYRLWTLKDNKLDKKSTQIVNKITQEYFLSTEVVEKIINERNIRIAENTYISKENIFVWPKGGNSNCDIGRCLGTIDHVAILVDGTVVPCCLDGEGIISLGNIFNEDLTDIINGDRFQKMYLGFKKNKITEELCKNCTFKNRFKV